MGCCIHASPTQDQTLLTTTAVLVLGGAWRACLATRSYIFERGALWVRRLPKSSVARNSWSLSLASTEHCFVGVWATISLKRSGCLGANCLGTNCIGTKSSSALPAMPRELVACGVEAISWTRSIKLLRDGIDLKPNLSQNGDGPITHPMGIQVFWFPHPQELRQHVTREALSRSGITHMIPVRRVIHGQPGLVLTGSRREALRNIVVFWKHARSEKLNFLSIFKKCTSYTPMSAHRVQVQCATETHQRIRGGRL